MPYFWISSQIPPRQVKRLSVIPKDLHLSSKAGDGKFTPVLPLCSSPRLPIANVHSSAWGTARHMQAEREKHTFPPWLFSSFFFFFCTISTCDQAGESQMWGIGPSICVAPLLQTDTADSSTSSARLWTTKSKNAIVNVSFSFRIVRSFL